MVNLASYFVASFACVLVTGYCNPTIERGTPPSAVVSADRSNRASDQIVDRSHKGDRLDRPAQAILLVRDI